MPAKSEKTSRNPRILASVEGPNASGRRLGKLLIYDSIGGWDGIRAKHVAEKLAALEEQGADDLEIRINSPGGDVFEGLAIHSAIASWGRGTKTVHVDGLSASIASVVMLAGDERVISPIAMVMVHNPRGFAMGGSKAMRDTADRLDKIRETMLDAYEAGTKLERKELAKLCDAETWMSAEEAVEKGFATAIARSEKRADDEDDDEDEDDEDSAHFRAVASALFENPPVDLLKLLNPPVAKAAAKPEEQSMPMTAEEQKKFDEAVRAAAEANAKLAAQTVELETARKTSAEVLSATGKASTSEAVAHVAGLTEKAKRTDELAARVTELETEKRQREIVGLLDEASKAGKLTPAKREELSKADAPAFAKDPVALKAFLDCLSPIVAKTGEGAAPAEGSTEKKPETAPVAELTDAEKEAAAKYGVNPEHMKIMKSGGAEALDKHLASLRDASAKK